MTSQTMNAPKQLDARESRFVSEYLIHLDPRRAAIEAGYAESVANSKSYSWVGNCRSKPHVYAAIAAATAERSQRTEVTADRVIQELAAIAFADPRKLFNADGSMKPLHEVDDDTRGALVIEVNQGTDSEGNPTFTRRTKFACKLVALDRLARHLGLLNDKLTVKAENPILMLIKQVQGSAIKPVIEGHSEDEYQRAA